MAHVDDKPGNAGEMLQNVVAWPLRILFKLLDFPISAIQRLIGIKRMPWFFLLPNLAFFGMFVILPLLMNFAYSITGGTELFLRDRPITGT